MTQPGGKFSIPIDIAPSPRLDTRKFSGKIPHFETPPNTSRFRQEYNRATPLNSLAVRCAATIGFQQERLSYDLADLVHSQKLSPSELLECAQPGLDKIQADTIQPFNEWFVKQTAEPDSMSSYRIAHWAETLDISTLWPLLTLYGHENNEAMTIRSEMSEAMYGYIGEMLGEMTSELYEGHNYSDAILKGIINELTLVALGNRGNNTGDRIVLLTDVEQDARGIDVMELITSPDGALYHNGWQVKTYDYYLQINPSGPEVVTGRMLGNLNHTANGRYGFRTAHMIKDETNGEFTRRSQSHLDTVTETLAQRVGLGQITHWSTNLAEY